MRGLWRSRSRAVENPTVFSQNPMKRFQTPTFKKSGSGTPGGAESRTHEVRKSLPGKYENRTVYRNTKIKRLIYILSIPILSELFSTGFSCGKPRIGKEWGKGAEWHNTQFYGLRSTRATPARPLEAHHERQKEQYASDPDIDISRSKYNFHIGQAGGTLLPLHSEPD